MKKEKGKFFVSNQGSLRPLPEVSFWEDVGGTSGDFLIKQPKKSEPPFEMDPATLEEIKGGERLW